MRMDVVDSQKSCISFVARKLNEGKTKKESARKPRSTRPSPKGTMPWYFYLKK